MNAILRAKQKKLQAEITAIKNEDIEGEIHSTLLNNSEIKINMIYVLLYVDCSS